MFDGNHHGNDLTSSPSLHATIMSLMAATYCILFQRAIDCPQHENMIDSIQVVTAIQRLD